MNTSDVLRNPLRRAGAPYKLSPERRQELTRRYAEDPSVTLQMLAEEYDVSKNTVWLIVQGDPWAKVTQLKSYIKELEARLAAKEIAEA